MGHIMYHIAYTSIIFPATPKYEPTCFVHFVGNIKAAGQVLGPTSYYCFQPQIIVIIDFQRKTILLLYYH